MNIVTIKSELASIETRVAHARHVLHLIATDFDEKLSNEGRIQLAIEAIERLDAIDVGEEKAAEIRKESERRTRTAFLVRNRS